jgi:hypothetical protein
MNDIERLRNIATSMIGEGNDSNSLKEGAELLKLVSEIENQTAGTKMLTAQEQKLTFDLRESRDRLKSGDRKAYIALLAPVFTTFVLAGTLALQSFQFSKTEAD